MLDGGRCLNWHLAYSITFLTHASVRRKEMADVNTAPAMRFAPSIIVHETC